MRLIDADALIDTVKSAQRSGKYSETTILAADIFIELLNGQPTAFDGEKRVYRIDLEGCDDETIFEMELTESEHQFLLKVAEKANETSTYGCMPRMYVTPYKEEGGEE